MGGWHATLHGATRHLEGRAPRRTRDDCGFTLLELLIVMVILGVLAAIAVFAVGGMNQATAVTACKADYKTVETALGAYETEAGQPARHLRRSARRRVAEGAAWKLQRLCHRHRSDHRECDGQVDQPGARPRGW